ncbi:MAG: hypothetical protein DRM98_01025 [Thermoplasmata archaeon]|nr:MAG: hypothetical protein DRM98_01025 [Thermoplasmata archaeon]
MYETSLVFLIIFHRLTSLHPIRCRGIYALCIKNCYYARGLVYILKDSGLFATGVMIMDFSKKHIFGTLLRKVMSYFTMVYSIILLDQILGLILMKKILIIKIHQMLN